MRSQVPGRRTLFGFSGIALVIAGCQSGTPRDAAQEGAGAAAIAAAPTPAQRGEYLVKAVGCADCHTPLMMGPNGPVPDMTRWMSGHPESMQMTPVPQLSGVWAWTGTPTLTAFAGPWGISFAANLTPDQNTGLGIWTEDMFINAIRQGKHMGTSRPIQPPMPWQWYRNFNDDDLKAMFAYLKTLPPIVNHVPDYQPPAGSGD